MSRVHVTESTSDPSLAPPFVGAHWVNTSTNKHWLANGTSSVANWVLFLDTDTGITQLTGDVTAGPGNGSQIATVNVNILRYNIVPITSNTAAVVGNTYFCDMTSGPFTLTLPASPSNGNWVIVKDSAHLFNTSNLTIARNGKQIESLSTDYILSQNDWSGTFLYNGTQWVIL